MHKLLLNVISGGSHSQCHVIYFALNNTKTYSELTADANIFIITYLLWPSFPCLIHYHKGSS